MALYKAFAMARSRAIRQFYRQAPALGIWKIAIFKKKPTNRLQV